MRKITKSCVNLTRRLDLEHEHVESIWYELKTKLNNIGNLEWHYNNTLNKLTKADKPNTTQY
jgi:hypothetical protein